MCRYIHLLTILADAFIKLCEKGAKRLDHPHHSAAAGLFVPHLNTFVTPSRLQSSPSFPNRDSTSFKISLGSTSTPAIPERQKVKSSHACNPVPTLTLRNDMKTGA